MQYCAQYQKYDEAGIRYGRHGGGHPQRHRSIASASPVRSRAAKGLTLRVSVPLLIEYEAVMTRPEHLKAARLSAADVGTLLDAVAAAAEAVRLAYLWRPMLSDANDDMVLEAAVNGGVYGIVTFNRRDFDPSVKQFGILALSPGEAVRLLEKRP